MSWWPRFHDPAYRPGFRDSVAIHWRANLLMLRSPKAVVGFIGLTIWPVGLLVGVLWLLGFTDENKPFWTVGWAGMAAFIAAFAGFFLLQHLSFLVALDRTYAPFVRRAMRARGTPVCVGCGQFLASLGVPRCSECGSSADEGRPPVAPG